MSNIGRTNHVLIMRSRWDKETLLSLSRQQYEGIWLGVFKRSSLSRRLFAVRGKIDKLVSTRLTLTRSYGQHPEKPCAPLRPARTTMLLLQSAYPVHVIINLV